MRGAQLKSILVALAKSEPLANEIVSHFTASGWKVDIYYSVESCWKAFEVGTTSICIIDNSLPGAQHFVRTVKGKKETSLIPVILLFATRAQAKNAEEFRVCGEQHIAYPLELRTLIVAVERELARSSAKPVFLQQLHMQVPTTEENLDKANAFVSELINKSDLSEEKQIGMSAAFREALINAAHHGNKYDHNKYIDIHYLLDKQKITIVVRDEGEGFDHCLFLERCANTGAVDAARERYEQGGLGGLGIMLMNKCADRIEYNQKGNIVTLTKFLSRTGAGGLKPEGRNEKKTRRLNT